MDKREKIRHKKVKGTEMVFRTLSLPAALIEDLKLLRDCYEDTWYDEDGKERVTYEKVFERLMSKAGLGHVDPDVYKAFMAAKERRKEFPEVVTRSTKSIISILFRQMETNGTSLLDEARMEKDAAVRSLEEARSSTPPYDKEE